MNDLETRFWDKVGIQGVDDCWNWLAYKDKDGYGQFTIEHNRQIPAHRMSWILTNGDIPDELQVLHNPIICKNKSCVNLKHLRLGTHVENHHDPDIAKLTWSQVREIRARYIKNSHFANGRILAKEFNVSYQHISEIINNVVWVE